MPIVALSRFPGTGLFSFCVFVCSIVTDFPGARWVQASVGVHDDLSPQVGDAALSLTPGDDQDGRWGDILSPGSLGFGFGFVSGDTKPYIFWHHKH
jgi:hypothetical protein